MTLNQGNVTECPNQDNCDVQQTAPDLILKKAKLALIAQGFRNDFYRESAEKYSFIYIKWLFLFVSKKKCLFFKVSDML